MKRLAMLFPLALGACGSSDLAGGGGIETNNTLSLKITSPGSASLAGALVRIRPTDWTGPDSSTAPGFLGTTDQTGSLTVPLQPGSWILEVRAGGRGRMETILQPEGGTTSLSLELGTFGSLHGRIWSPTRKPVHLRMAGTPRQVQTDSSGTYRIDSLSPGTLRLLLADGSGRTDSLRIRPASPDTLLWTGDPSVRAQAEQGTVVMDEFLSERPTLAGVDPDVNWYLADDQPEGGKSRVQRIDGSAASSWSDLLVPGEVDAGGGSAQLRFAVDTTTASTNGHYAQVGMSFTALGFCLDLSTLDSVSFMARSTGPVRLEFRSAVHDSLKDYTSYPGYDLPPSATWQKVSIPISRLVPPATATSPQLDWTRSRGCVLEMRFISLRPATLGLGRLVMHGPGPQPFLNPIRP